MAHIYKIVCFRIGGISDTFPFSNGDCLVSVKYRKLLPYVNNSIRPLQEIEIAFFQFGEELMEPSGFQPMDSRDGSARCEIMNPNPGLVIFPFAASEAQLDLLCDVLLGGQSPRLSHNPEFPPPHTAYFHDRHVVTLLEAGFQLFYLSTTIHCQRSEGFSCTQDGSASGYR